LKGENALLEMAQEEEKEGKTKYFFGPHTKSQSNVLTQFHYTPRTKKSCMTSKMKNNLNVLR
jgi:hypothetical protein